AMESAVAQAEGDLPKSAGRKGGAGKSAGKNGAKTAEPAPDAPRRVVKGEAAAKKSKAKPKAKSTGTASPKREASEDPDVDSIPARNPEVERHDGEWYWLMKAEPEPRFENGIDVSFSIDDLRAREVPEPWDGEIIPLPPQFIYPGCMGSC
ncbi:hypothetical protein IMZ48_12615, partial [Candidatus Bathyarchaeota archaeon]|nr:hypothetical protein [Candidatus Bathyarchaeota archaeon]